jgi:hypothetical protein
MPARAAASGNQDPTTISVVTVTTSEAVTVKILPAEKAGVAPRTEVSVAGGAPQVINPDAGSTEAGPKATTSTAGEQTMMLCSAKEYAGMICNTAAHATCHVVALLAAPATYVVCAAAYTRQAIPAHQL